MYHYQRTCSRCCKVLWFSTINFNFNVILFCCYSTASTPKGRIYPVLEEPRSLFTAALGKKAAPLVQNRISKSDAVILLTDKPVYEIPSHLHNLKGVCSGRVYLWCSYGVCCALLGGSVNNKRVAMQLRALLEDSDNLLGRILPRPWNLEKMYNVDPKFETGEPCVT